MKEMKKRDTYVWELHSVLGGLHALHVEEVGWRLPEHVGLADGVGQGTSHLLRWRSKELLVWWVLVY